MGSTDINDRGESLFDYILSTNLLISNVDNEPTFITKNRQEVLDITLVSDSINNNILNWKVSKDHSFSDHRYIQFNFMNVPTIQPIFQNLKRTNWPKYERIINSAVRPELFNIPSNIEDLDDKVNNLT